MSRAELPPEPHPPQSNGAPLGHRPAFLVPYTGESSEDSDQEGNTGRVAAENGHAKLPAVNGMSGTAGSSCNTMAKPPPSMDTQLAPETNGPVAPVATQQNGPEAAGSPTMPTEKGQAKLNGFIHTDELSPEVFSTVRDQEVSKSLGHPRVSSVNVTETATRSSPSVKPGSSEKETHSLLSQGTPVTDHASSASASAASENNTQSLASCPLATPKKDPLKPPAVSERKLAREARANDNLGDLSPLRPQAAAKPCSDHTPFIGKEFASGGSAKQSKLDTTVSSWKASTVVSAEGASPPHCGLPGIAVGSGNHLPCHLGRVPVTDDHTSLPRAKDLVGSPREMAKDGSRKGPLENGGQVPAIHDYLSTGKVATTLDCQSSMSGYREVKGKESGPYSADDRKAVDWEKSHSHRDRPASSPAKEKSKPVYKHWHRGDRSRSRERASYKRGSYQSACHSRRDRSHSRDCSYRDRDRDRERRWERHGYQNRDYHYRPKDERDRRYSADNRDYEKPSGHHYKDWPHREEYYYRSRWAEESRGKAYSKPKYSHGRPDHLHSPPPSSSSSSHHWEQSRPREGLSHESGSDRKCRPPDESSSSERKAKKHKKSKKKKKSKDKHREHRERRSQADLDSSEGNSDNSSCKRKKKKKRRRHDGDSSDPEQSRHKAGVRAPSEGQCERSAEESGCQPPLQDSYRASRKRRSQDRDPPPHPEKHRRTDSSHATNRTSHLHHNTGNSSSQSDTDTRRCSLNGLDYEVNPRGLNGSGSQTDREAVSLSQGLSGDACSGEVLRCSEKDHVPKRKDWAH